MAVPVFLNKRQVGITDFPYAELEKSVADPIIAAGEGQDLNNCFDYELKRPDYSVATPSVPTVVAKAAVTGKHPADKVLFTDLFTFGGGSTAANYNFVVTPGAAGTVDATGVTLAAGAAGDVSVKATHKVTATVTATATIAGVAA